LAPAIWYLLASVPWILLSDRVLLGIAPDGEVLTVLQTGKGWVFALLSTLLIAVISIRQHRMQALADEALHAGERRALAEYRRLLERIAALEQGMGAAADFPTVCHALHRFMSDTVPLERLTVCRYEAGEEHLNCIELTAEDSAAAAASPPRIALSE